MELKGQCPTCGRCDQDWMDRANMKVVAGSKGIQNTEDAIDRAFAYKSWHRTLGPQCAATDVDVIEWRYGRPVAVHELTSIPGNREIPPSYLEAISNRYRRDGQGRYAGLVAEALDCPLQVIAYRWDLSEFWVWFVPGEWQRFNQAEFADFIREL